MFHGICYLFGNDEMPLLRGTVTFREERKNYICIDIDIHGVSEDYWYGIQVGAMLFPPIAADTEGVISVIFCRKGDFDGLFPDPTISLFRLERQLPLNGISRQNIASGKVRKVICGGKDYRGIK